MLVLAVVLVVVAFSTTYLIYRVINPSDRNDLESRIDAEVNKTMKNRPYPGIVVGVYRAGKSQIKGFGVVSEETPHAPDAETVFQIGSVSKLITAMLLQRLCDEGVVSMDNGMDPLHFLTGFAMSQNGS